jgi:hypothetical protein
MNLAAMFRPLSLDAEQVDMVPENSSSGNSATRIRPDDVLIKRPAVQRLMGDISTSAVYDDPDLMRLKVSLVATGDSAHAVRWIEREVLDLRAQRVARSAERAANVGAEIERRRESRRARQRMKSGR